MTAVHLDAADYVFNAHAVPPALTALWLLVLGVAVLVSERASRVSLAFFSIMLAVSLWLTGIAATYASNDALTAVRWSVFGFIGVSFIPSTVYCFSVVVMGIQARRRVLVRIGWLLSTVFAVVTLSSGALITHVHRYWWGYYPQYGMLAVPFLAFFVGFVVVTVRDYWTEYRKAAPGTRKLRLRALLMAYCIFFLGAVDYLPCYGIAVYPFGYLPVLVWFALLARAIRQYRLVDIVPAFAANEILATMADPLVVCDAEGRIRVVNRALCATFAYTQAELLGAPLECLAHAEGIAALRRLLSSGTGHDEELLFSTRDGEPVAVSVSVSTLRDRAGDVVGSVVIARDIREAKRVEAALRHSEERTRLIIENAMDPVITLDATGAVIGWNSQAERAFGWPRHEILGRRLAETIVPPRYRSAHARGMQRFLATGEGRMANQTIEVTALHRDGHEFPIELSIWPVKLGDQLTFSGFARDITERKRAQTDLQQAKEAAEAASRAKSEFLANMSHEIRTPMNGIIGMTELTLNTELTSEQREYLTMVQSSADSLLTVINDILDFSKVEAGKLELYEDDFSLRETLGETLKSLGVRAAAKALELACEIPSETPDALVGDAGRLRQVLVNLVGNALKFTARGEVVVRVTEETQTADAIGLHFTVTDTGIGIPAEKQQRIFNAFEQADGSTTRSYGGTGLGLAIAARLVGLMGGTIWVESALDTGSCFHFTARFRRAAQRLAPRPRSMLPLRGLATLVVDDNATNRRVLCETLSHWQMRPTAVDGGPAGLTALQRAVAVGTPFPLVLLDAQMPGMDGFALAKRIKETPELASATIMMLSSPDLPGDAARCRALGIAVHLAKPIKQSELLDALLGVIAPDVVEAHTANAAPSPRPGPALRVLLAEDNSVNQKVMVRMLEQMGHRAVVAANGTQALAALERDTFDMVLMDVQMPEMDGLEAAALIREREHGTSRHLPIVALTAHAMKGDEERCLLAGMDAYISKPVASDKLVAIIERLFAGDAGNRRASGDGFAGTLHR